VREVSCGTRGESREDGGDGELCQAGWKKRAASGARTADEKSLIEGGGERSHSVAEEWLVGERGTRVVFSKAGGKGLREDNDESIEQFMGIKTGDNPKVRRIQEQGRKVRGR